MAEIDTNSQSRKAGELHQLSEAVHPALTTAAAGGQVKVVGAKMGGMPRCSTPWRCW